MDHQNLLEPYLGEKKEENIEDQNAGVDKLNGISHDETQQQPSSLMDDTTATILMNQIPVVVTSSGGGTTTTCSNSDKIVNMEVMNHTSTTTAFISNLDVLTTTTTNANDSIITENIHTDHTNNMMIPQMNVYVLDDTPSVSSHHHHQQQQQSLLMTPVKDTTTTTTTTVMVVDDTMTDDSQHGMQIPSSSSMLLHHHHHHRSTSHSPCSHEPDTTLSLDKEESVSDLDKSPPSDQDRIPAQTTLEALHGSSSNHIMITARTDIEMDRDHDNHTDDEEENNNEEDDDSSHDDSSYFASHLPEPNSGRRRYSFASNASQHSTTPPSQQQQQQQQNQGTTGTNIIVSSSSHHHHKHPGRESDASLSFSDDSDDNNDNNNNTTGRQHPLPQTFGPMMSQQQQQFPFYQQQQQQQYPVSYYQYQDPYSHQFYPQQPILPNQQQQPTSIHPPPISQHPFVLPPRTTIGGGSNSHAVVVPELYPEQIMPKIHSINSLASTSSHNSSDNDNSSIQDDDEIQNVIIDTSSSQRYTMSRGHSTGSYTIPSGRRSPILGEHPPSRTGRNSNSTHSHQQQHQQQLLPHQQTITSQQLVTGSPSTVNLQPSPPMILHSFSAGSASATTGGTTNQIPIDGHYQNFLHPQPHSMTPEQLAAWTASTTQGMDTTTTTGSHNYGQNTISSVHSVGAASFVSVVGSKGESDFAYSGDSDSHHMHMYHSKNRDSSKHAFGEPNRNGGGGGSSMKRHSTSNAIDRNLDVPAWDHPVDPRIADGGYGIDPETTNNGNDNRGFKVYWQRWIMLMYMSILNLLSDWTCYSVAPIALLTEEAFGEINAEQLVVVFLIANGIATACEPIILSRLGLRRTVLFGALLLMIGSIVKSGGMPPIIQADLKKGRGEWRVYLGFFLVGLSQPLYQCTPALLSASWFPEAERTLATGVALNANQLGIGFAFIFGTMLVSTSDDIPKYFSLLSILSTLTFLGTLIQFDDAPPTPPSDTAKVMRGTLEAKLPTVQSLFETVRNIGVPSNPFDNGKQDHIRKSHSHTRKEKSRSRTHSNQNQVSVESKIVGNKSDDSETYIRGDVKRRSARRGGTDRRSSRRISGSGSNNARRRIVQKSNVERSADTGFQALVPSPSPARWGPVRQGYNENNLETEDGATSETPLIPVVTSPPQPPLQDFEQHAETFYPQQPFFFPGYLNQSAESYGQYPLYPNPYQYPYFDPQYAQFAYFQQHPAQLAFQQPYPMLPSDPYSSYQHTFPHPFTTYDPPEHLLPATEAIDEGAEPVITILPHHLDIHIRDDQIWLSTRACLARPGFIHSLVSFTVSGVVINTLSTFMDYLVRLNGAGREYTGIVGGTFQFVIMISSLIIGKVCDKTRAYYSITIGMLVLGAFGLAECGVSLDSNSGVNLRWSLIVVALLVGPLQPVSTELGVDVVYPLSENTVLVIQQLFSNLLSAMFIPCFKAMKDVGKVSLSDGATIRPEYTFSFYLVIVVHACATVFFATFNGRYLRYEHELEKQAQEERRKKQETSRAFNRIDRGILPQV